MHINFNDLLYTLFGIISAYFTFRLNSKKNDEDTRIKERDYIVEQNDRLNRENEKLRRENEKLRKELEQ